MFILKDYLYRTKLLLLLFFLLSILGVGLFIYLISKPAGAAIKINNNAAVKDQKEKFSIEISDNFFSSPKNFSLDEYLPDFSGKIKVILNELRPDALPGEKNLEMILLSNKSSKVISSGEKIFLSNDNGFNFSESPTDLWISTSLSSPNSSKITFGAKYLDQNNTLCEKEKRFDLAILDCEINEAILRADEGYLSLKNAIFLGPDLFLDLCDQNRDKAQLSRLIFPSKDSCFIKNGDLLIFKEGKWQVALESDTKEYSLARVSLLNPNALDIDYWKKGERGRAKIRLAKPAAASNLHVNDDFISELNVRTKKQVSCKIQGQRIILTEKDLLYKKDGIWKKGILTDFENRNDIAEFFLFEKLDVTPGVKTFVGYLFNPDKTQMARVEKKIVKKISEPQADKAAKIRQVKKRR